MGCVFVNHNDGQFSRLPSSSIIPDDPARKNRGRYVEILLRRVPPNSAQHISVLYNVSALAESLCFSGQIHFKKFHRRGLQNTVSRISSVNHTKHCFACEN